MIPRLLWCLGTHTGTPRLRSQAGSVSLRVPSSFLCLSPALPLLPCLPPSEFFMLPRARLLLAAPSIRRVWFSKLSQLCQAQIWSAGVPCSAPNVPTKIAAATYWSGEEQVSLGIKMTDPSIEVSEGLCFIKQQ